MPSAQMHCPHCKDVVPHISKVPDKRQGTGPQIEEWHCSKCGANNGTGQ